MNTKWRMLKIVDVLRTQLLEARVANPHRIFTRSYGGLLTGTIVTEYIATIPAVMLQQNI